MVADTLALRWLIFIVPMPGFRIAMETFFALPYEGISR